MKALKDTLNEARGKHKSGPLKKLHILTLLIPYESWNEMNIFDDFFIIEHFYFYIIYCLF